MKLRSTYKNLKKGKTGFLVFAFFVSSILTYAQQVNVTEEDIINQANELFSKKDYQGALPLYAQLVSVHPAEPEFNFRFGVCTLFGDRHDKKKPIRYLNNASKTMKDNQELIYCLGLAYHQNEEYAPAMRYYNMYLAKLAPNSSERPAILEKVNACLNGLNLSHKRLISEIISTSEFQQENFYRAYRNDELEGSLVVKPEIFQTAKEKKRSEMSFVYISEPRNILYYAGYENEKSPNKDIFRVVMDDNGNWGEPVKLDATVNTPFDEDYPVLMDNGTTLYFCSKGHSSLGGYDIYRSKLDTTNNTFSQPENLGTGINSPFDDILFIIDKEGKGAYFASDRDNLNGSINVFKVALHDNPFNEDVLLAEESNLEEIFTQRQQKISHNQNQSGQGQRNAAVAAYKAAHEHNPNTDQQSTVQTPSAASQKADDLMADRTSAHQMADSAYLVIAETKELIRDLTNKRDRANAISRRKADEAKALEERFDESISMILKTENESQFKTSLSKAIELKVEVCQLYKRSEIANQIAWNLGRQIKTKNMELEKLKLQAGKIQTASVSGTLDESLQIFTNFKELVIKADTIVDFTDQIMAITNNHATYEVPKSELAFAEKLTTAFHNNTLMAEAINLKPKVQEEDVPKVIVDKRTYKPEEEMTASSKPQIKPVRQIELIPQIEIYGNLIAGNESIEDELEINFSIDKPTVQIPDMVEPVEINHVAFNTEPIELDLELSFAIDQVKPLNQVLPVDMTYVAFSDIIVEEDQLDISFDIDQRQIEFIPIPEFIAADDLVSIYSEPEDELEINFEADKKPIRVVDIIMPVSIQNLALKTEPEDYDLELDFKVDQIEPVKLIQPINIHLIAFNKITVDEETLEINFASDQNPIDIAPLIAPVYKENLANTSNDSEVSLEVDYEVDKPDINIVEVAKPVYVNEDAFHTQPEEMDLEIDFSADKIAFVDLIYPIDIASVVLSDLFIDEDVLEIDMQVDQPNVEIASIIDPIYYIGNEDDPEQFETDLDISFTIDIADMLALGLVEPVYTNELSASAYPEESEIEINIEPDEITSAAPDAPVEIANNTIGDISTDEASHEINMQVSKPVASRIPQIQPIYLAGHSKNTLPEESDLEINFSIDRVSPVKIAEPINFNYVALIDKSVNEEILELNFDADRLEVHVISQTEPIMFNAYALHTEVHEPELEISFTNDQQVLTISEPISAIAYTPTFVMPEMENELEINFHVDRKLEIPQVAETVEYASNTNLQGEVMEDIIQIDFDVDKQLQAFLEAKRVSRQEALFYLRESIMHAKNIETSKSDLEILELALTTPDELTYEELLYAASLAFRPEDKLIIYNAAFIHIDRDWRAYNNAAVSAIHIASLGQADCYLFQASLISENNGSIENNRGILACYKDQFDKAMEHFVAASELGYDALYNLQVVNNLVNELEVERIADRDKMDQKDTQKVVVDVIDYSNPDD